MGCVRRPSLPALIRPASVLVLDEPVVGLDPPSQALLCEQLSERRRAGNAVLLTTHQMAFVDGLADRAVVLDEGSIESSCGKRDRRTQLPPPAGSA